MSASKLQSNNLVDNIPANWNTTLLRFLLKKKITDGPHETPEFVDEGYPFLSVDGIQNGELVFEGCRFISEEAHVEYSKKVKPIRGDLLMGKAASTGKIAQVKVDFEFSIWSPLAWIRPNEKISSDFLELALKSDYCQAQIEMLCTHSTQNNISMQDIPRIRIHYPPRNYQDSISAFLNEKISNLNIAEEQLNLELNLLEENRSTLITQAVTKSLDQNVPMKDSGNDLIGQIPEHWQLIPLKHLVTLNDDTLNEDTEPNYEIEYVDIGSVKSGKGIVDSEMLRFESAPSRARRIAIDGDIAISTVRTYLKAVCTVQNPPKNLIFSTGFAIIRPHSILSKFAGYSLSSDYFVSLVSTHSEGVSYPAINSGEIGNLPVCLPPKDEQIAISEYLEQQSNIIIRKSAKLELQIQRLIEYKVALISAAVTGKIDIHESV